MLMNSLYCILGVLATLQREIKDDYRVVSGWLLYCDEQRRSYERSAKYCTHQHLNSWPRCPEKE